MTKVQKDNTIASIKYTRPERIYPPKAIKKDNITESGKQESVNDKPFEKTGRLSPDEAKKIASNYKRIGTEYYLYRDILTAKKKPVKILKKWRKTIIKDDHGSKVLEEIEKYYDFVLVPDNTENYKRNVAGCYNIYEPIHFQPIEGNFPNTEKFLIHIFGEYLDLGLDYLSIIFTQPTQRLPALCLVSKVQKTGKTTFLHWLCEIYGDNSVILGNEDFGSNFNTSWASKLIIGIDESFIEKRVIKEKIKRLVTDDSILSENKGVDKVRRDFIGKFILLSNNEENFIQMEKEDSRFFVLKIPSVKDEDPDLEEKLLGEIPAFLYFLKTRELKYEKKSRLWFKPEDYETEALKAVVKSSKTVIEKTMIDTLTHFMDNIRTLNEYRDINAIHITPKRLAENIKDDIRYSSALHIRIGEIFKDWGLTPNNKPERYKYPFFEPIFNQIDNIMEQILKFKSETGKFYTITFERLDKFLSE